METIARLPNTFGPPRLSPAHGFSVCTKTKQTQEQKKAVRLFGIWDTDEGEATDRGSANQMAGELPPKPIFIWN